MPGFIFPIINLLIAILIVVAVFKIGKGLISKLLGLFVSLFLIFGAYASYTQNIKTPMELIRYTSTQVTNGFDWLKAKFSGKEIKVPEVSDKSIANKLLSYTNSQSAGPTGNYYWENGAAKLASDNDLAVGTLSFSHDNLGRASVARGKLTYQMFADSKGSRQGTPLDPPNGGWPVPNTKTAITYSKTGRTYHGYFWNRSHSIADSLGGAATYTSADNFTAGSRAQNVGADQNGGMRAAEEIAEDYWHNHHEKNAVIHYQVTPVYNGSEKIPRGSIVDIKSDDGAVNKRLVIINSAEGHRINYNTGAID